MLITTAHYIGPAKSGLAAKIGFYATRFGQRSYGEAGKITHTEIIISGSWYSAKIGSSSIVDHGVRVRETQLNSKHWIILQRNLENFDDLQIPKWFDEHAGEKYDFLGAIGSVMPALIQDKSHMWFCTESVGASMLHPLPHTLCPAAFYIQELFMGAQDITTQFFEL